MARVQYGSIAQLASRYNLPVEDIKFVTRIRDLVFTGRQIHFSTHKTGMTFTVGAPFKEMDVLVFPVEEQRRKDLSHLIGEALLGL